MGGAMHTRSSLILLVVATGTVLPSQFVTAKRAAADLLGQGLDQHYKCDSERPRHCSEGVKLTFGSANGAISLAVDFVVRDEPQGGSNPPSRIELLVALTPALSANTMAAPGLMLRM